jgi:hypothetical protein
MNMSPKPNMKVRALILTGAISVLTSAAGHAGFQSLPSPTPESPGVALDAMTLGLTGTVLQVLDSPFVDNALPEPFASGMLRTLVVDRDPTAGVAIDFYYQLVNTTPVPRIADPDLEFFRMKTVGGFDPSLMVSVAQTTMLTGLVAGVGSGFVPGAYTTGFSLKGAATADRDVGSIGSVGFNFPTQPPFPFTDDPRNIAPGQASSFLVVRTNASTYAQVEMQVSGSATGIPLTFAAVPEPSSILFGLAILGTCFTRRSAAARRRAQD